MRGKIEENLRKNINYKKIPTEHGEIYSNENHGWKDYLLSGKVIFSYRDNHYSKNEFGEKLHSHDFYELTIPLSSDGVEFVSDEKTVSVKGGMAILAKPRKVHMFRITKRSRYKRFVLYFKDIEQLFSDETIVKFTKMGNSSFALFRPQDDYALSLAEEVLLNLENGSSQYNFAKAQLRLCELFLTLSEDVSKEENFHSTTPKFIHEIKKYVDENYLKISSVEEIAEKFFYSREYLSRSFKKYYNTPVYEYVIGRKMLNCTALLRKGESVETSARSSGFNNMSSFIKLFKKFNGCTPSEYKAKHTEYD